MRWLLALGGAVAATLVLAATTTFGAGAAGATGAPSLSWTRTAAAGGPPSLRDPAMAYDSDIGAVVLYGGTLPDGSLSDQTWTFDGTTWTNETSATTVGPGGRTGASMAFDASTHQLILFGGVDATGTFLDDTWAWNGVSWYEETASTLAPPGREGAAMAPDVDGSLVLFGGTGVPAPPSSSQDAPPTSAGGSPDASAGTSAVPTALDDTWTWNGTQWQQVSTPPALTARTDAAAAYDPLHHQTVLFGGTTQADGSGATRPAVAATTWIWSGTAWTPSAAPTGPPARSGAALVGDPTAGGAVLVGGVSGTALLGDTWLWDGSTWAQLQPAGAPPAVSGAGAAYDSSAAQLLIFGGTSATPVAMPAGYLLGATRTTPPVTSPTAPPTTAPTRVTPPTQVVRPGPTPTTPTTAPAVRRSTTPTTAAAAPAVTPTRPPVEAAPAPPTPGIETVHPGSSILLLGAGFRPGARITVTFHSTPQHIGTFTANSSGAFSVTVTVPAEAAAGTHHFVMSGPGPAGTMTLTTAVLVVALAGGHPGPSLQAPILVGIAILLPVGTWFGTGALGRRRSRSTRAV